MGEKDSPEVAWLALRRAINTRDWSGCLGAVEELLRRLPAHQALEMARLQVERRLPAFERHQPGVTWPRDLLLSLRASDPSEDLGQPWPWEDDAFSGPGANNFTSALEALWQARQLPVGDARRIETLADAISGAILAEMLEAWGARHPEQWARRYALGLSLENEPELYALQRSMVREPETVRIERSAWLDVADRLAEALGLALPNPLPE
jgi:hypothetical protein